MVHGLAPSYLNNLVPPLVQKNSQYSLRNARNMQTLQCNTNLFYNSFLPSAIRGWNNLSDDLRKSPSFSVFKSKLYAERNKPPSYHNHGLRTLQVYHTRLRLECSSLNSHFYKKKIVESPQCSCGAAETSKHYLLNCPNYTILRNQVLNNYLHMPIKTLLSGDPQLSGEEEYI